jgi:sphingomyelin phosphodiesterase acid-like 3
MRRFLAGLVFLASVWPAAIFNKNAAISAQQRSRDINLSVEQNQGTFLVLADIHFDPLADGLDSRSFAQLSSRPVQDWQAIFQSSEKNNVASDGEDANYPLLISALQAAKTSGRQYDYVLLMGDYLTHNFPQKYAVYRPDGKGYENFVVKTAVFVSRMIQQAFPTIPIYGALGNNDSTTGDYAAPGDALLAGLAKEWKIISTDREASKNFRAGGYYAVPHPTVRDSEFIVVDSTFFSSRYDTPSIAKGDRGTNELNWLDGKLKEAEEKHKTAILMMHIPPGIDVFESAKFGACGKPVLFWKRPYLDSFLSIITSHEKALRDSYAGHIHTDDFRVFTDTAGVPFLQMDIAPSISRDHHNNPAFEIGVYDKSDGALSDYEVIAMKNAPNVPGGVPEPVWRAAYDFRQESGAQAYGPETLKNLSDLIRSSDSLRQRFMNFYRGQMSSGTPVNLSNWQLYSCAETEMTPENYGRCACPSHESNP